MSNALGELFGSIADAIREKTGDTAKMKPVDFPEKITAIEAGGGGSSADVRYVTFMSEDGSETYGVKPVAVGDDCANPIARGLFSTPTKASSAQYNYTFAGWATAPNGGLDSNALKAVTEDRSLFANFASVLRTYTIRFWDGDTVLKSITLTYGSTPSITDPEKSGYSFDCWNPAISAVTGDADYYAQWTMNLNFANATWADIASVAESGNAANVFALGDTRTIPVKFNDGNTYNVDFEIVGFNHDNLADGSGKAGITVISKQILPGNKSCGVTEGYWKVKSWDVSDIRTALNNVFYNGLPSDLKPYVKTVTKLSANKDKAINASEDKIWIPSGTELGALAIASKVTACTDGQGECYPHFVAPDEVLGGSYLKSANLKKTMSAEWGTVDNTNSNYATRSPSSQNGTYYNIYVTYGGALKGSGNQIGTAFVYGFCI